MTFVSKCITTINIRRQVTTTNHNSVKHIVRLSLYTRSQNGFFCCLLFPKSSDFWVGSRRLISFFIVEKGESFVSFPLSPAFLFFLEIELFSRLEKCENLLAFRELLEDGNGFVGFPGGFLE